MVQLKKAKLAVGLALIILAISPFCTAITQAGNLNWNIAGVDYWADVPPNGSSPPVGSLALDTEGNPHILCNGKYMVWTGSSWNVQNTSFSGQLVLDKNNNPHACFTVGKYYNADLYLYDIMYASLSGSNWTTEQVASQLYPEGSPSLALDQNGNPHIAYMMGSAHLMYASKNSSGWSSQIVDPNAYGGAKLIFDSQNNPFITYESAADSNYKYDRATDYSYRFSVANWNGTTWNIQNLVGENQGCSIALDANGNPCIFYAHHYSESWNYASWNGTNWNSQIVASNLTYGISYSALVIDAQNIIHVVFWTYGDSFHYRDTGHLEYATYDGSSWNIQEIDYQLSEYADLNLALDSTGQPHILYAYRDSKTLVDKNNLPYIENVFYQKYASPQNLPSITTVPTIPNTNLSGIFQGILSEILPFAIVFVIGMVVFLAVLLVIAISFQRQLKKNRK
jgi:hypothetical protein